MAALKELVARIPNVALVVDDDFKIEALSPAVTDSLRLEGYRLIGKTCYDVVAATDSGTGLPCHERCAIARGLSFGRPLYGRVLEIHRGRFAPGLLDCFVLKAVLPENPPVNLCILGAASGQYRETHLGLLEATGAIYAASARDTSASSVDEWAAECVEAIARSIEADSVDLLLVEPGTLTPVLVAGTGPTGGQMGDLWRSLLSERFPGFISGHPLPLVALHQGNGDKRWHLAVPLVAGGHVIGAIGVSKSTQAVDVLNVMRVLFPVSVQMSLYLRSSRHGSDGRLSPAQAPRLRIFSLGRFRVMLDDAPVPLERFQRLKAVSALKLLAANRGRPVSREALGELLWPDGDPVRARGSLRVVLHCLRRALALEAGEDSFIVGEGDMLSLDPSEQVWVDTEEFLTLVKRGAQRAAQGRDDEALAAYQQAVALYQGDYLEDEPYSDWCLFDREHLREAFISCLRQMASLYVRRGEAESAIAIFRRALAADHAREDIHRQLMVLLAESGQRDEALRQYETCCRILDHELGIEPSEATRRTYRAILTASSDAG